MPVENIGLDTKMSLLDMDPKTYSPMSVSDENMSSPPSVLTAASAGSCTPSSLPSAGSTPSSIQSAGSTPYQFISQEESTIIKPVSLDMGMTSDQPFTPDPAMSSYQPITPDQHNPSTPNSQAAILEKDNSDINKIVQIPSLANASEKVSKTSVAYSISEDVNQRRDDCSCIMCDNMSSGCLSAAQRQVDNNPTLMQEGKPNRQLTWSYSASSSSKEHNKVRKKTRATKKTYKSEISADPDSSSIKIKIKLTSSSSNKSVEYYNPDPDFHPTAPYYGLKKRSMAHDSYSAKKKRASSKGRGAKRKIMREPSFNNEYHKKKKVTETFTDWGPVLDEVNGEPQSPWACQIPYDILRKIFLFATETEGCIPFLHRMSKVCRLWRQVSVDPSLWHTVDLTNNYIRQSFPNEKKLLWLIEHRFKGVKDLNLGGWVEAMSPAMLLKITEICTKLEGLNLSFCYKLHAEYLNAYLLSSKHLCRLDLTNIMGAHKPTPRSAVGQQTMSDLSLSMQGRLTHLILANNTLSNVPSILNSLSENCPKLEVLDLSSFETVGRDSVRLNIEKLQTGCPNLRVLRLSKSLFRLTDISIAVQVLSPGFPQLEELSVAVDDKLDSGIQDTELERILKNSNKLIHLDVQGCRHISDSSLIRIPPWDLQNLFLAGGSLYKSYSDRLELVIRKWRQSLMELDLSWTGTSDSVDNALLALAEEKNDQLRSLNLRGSSATFVPIRKILSNCVSLQWLNLTSCHALPRGAKRTYMNVAEIEKFQLDILGGRFDDPPQND